MTEILSIRPTASKVAIESIYYLNISPGNVLCFHYRIPNYPMKFKQIYSSPEVGNLEV